MKVDWNKKYLTISVYAFIVILSSIALYYCVLNLNLFKDMLKGVTATMQPFIVGGVIAYFVNYILNFYEIKVLQKWRFANLSKKLRRGLGIVLAYITAMAIVYIFVRIIFPQVIDSVVGLVNNVPQYIADTTVFMSELFEKIDIPEDLSAMVVERLNEILSKIFEIVSNAVPALANTAMSIVSSVWNIVLGIIISIYILIDKDKFASSGRKICYAVLDEGKVDRLLILISKSNDTFSRFIGGKILDSFIIGILTFVVLIVFKMPYALLVSVIVGITNIIPVFGPFIGAIPGFLIIVFVSPVQALWFLLIVLVIQQIDGNIIGPYILGDSVGLSAFWIIFSVTIFGKLLGVTGMIIGVPIFAIIYSLLKEYIENRLNKKGLPIETSQYDVENLNKIKKIK